MQNQTKEIDFLIPRTIYPIREITKLISLVSDSCIHHYSVNKFGQVYINRYEYIGGKITVPGTGNLTYTRNEFAEKFKTTYFEIRGWNEVRVLAEDIEELRGLDMQYYEEQEEITKNE